MLDPHVSVPNPFFIFFPERSGSTFLVHLLNEHPEVYCEHELFCLRKDAAGETSPVHTDDSKKTQLLEKVYSYPDAKASGFKFKFKRQYEAYPDVYRFFLRRVSSIRQIFLYRKNLLKASVSRQNLERLKDSGNQHYLPHDSSQDLKKIELDLPKALSYIRHSSRELNFFRRASEIFEHRLEVAYEDLLANPQATLARIFEFLGVGSRPINDSFPIRKITDDKLELAVANYGEMVSFFSDTRFSGFVKPETV